MGLNRFQRHAPLTTQEARTQAPRLEILVRLQCLSALVCVPCRKPVMRVDDLLSFFNSSHLSTV